MSSTGTESIRGSPSRTGGLQRRAPVRVHLADASPHGVRIEEAIGRDVDEVRVPEVLRPVGEDALSISAIRWTFGAE